MAWVRPAILGAKLMVQGSGLWVVDSGFELGALGVRFKVEG